MIVANHHVPTGSTPMTTIEHTVRTWDAIDNPECENCHGLSRPIRKKTTCREGLVQLAFSPKAMLRRRLIQLMHDSRLPQAEFSETVLGLDSVTLYRYLRGAMIPQSKAKQLRSIEHVTRDGAFTIVVYHTGSESQHWDMMLNRRARKLKRPMHLSAVAAGKSANIP